MQTGQQCEFRECSGNSNVQNTPTYCNEVTSITYRVPVSQTNATFFLHDGQFYGEVEWPQQDRPCGGGGPAGGGCAAPSKVCNVSVALSSVCPTSCGQSPSPSPSPAQAKLALLVEYQGFTPPYSGSNPGLAATSTLGNCTETPATRLNTTAGITYASPGTGLCNVNGTVAPGTYALLPMTAAPATTSFSRWVCYNTTSGTAVSPVNATSIVLGASQSATCVAIYIPVGTAPNASPVPSPSPSPQASPSPAQAKLALLVEYQGFTPPYSGSNPGLAATSTLGNCTETPATRLNTTAGITYASPGTGLCNVNGTVAPGTYALLPMTAAPATTRFSRWVCYNTTSGTAVGPVNATSIVLGASQSATCVAIYIPSGSQSPSPAASPSPSPAASPVPSDNGGCSTNCDLYRAGGSCAAVTCTCGSTGQYDITYRLKGSAGGTQCKSAISWACCVKGNTMQTGQQCEFRECSGNPNVQNTPTYCNEVTSITYRVPVSQTNATFFLHDGQFYGEVEWPQQDRPCGGGGPAGGGCTARSKVCKVPVALGSICPQNCGNAGKR
ncbi:hypothetical protein COO60DRAFT_580972 [Scenedesmus sp. NREL 46B-D3]|nr:hypothetical protein COO60DRAFT_580972 [Scenedesmus sp. NREL 46B-D3]